MKELEGREIEQALQSERLIEPSKFGMTALAESVDELVAEVNDLTEYVEAQNDKTS